jgi:ketosteroid isomerase-like protein
MVIAALTDQGSLVGSTVCSVGERQITRLEEWAVDHDDAMRMLKAITTAFDAHDLDGIVACFADDAVFEGPRGPDPWGQRYIGREAIRDAFAARFAGVPDIRYQHDAHFVDGDRGASEWTLSGTTTDGQRIEVRGCDLWTMRDGKIVKKDSFWKIRSSA